MVCEYDMSVANVCPVVWAGIRLEMDLAHTVNSCKGCLVMCCRKKHSNLCQYRHTPVIQMSGLLWMLLRFSVVCCSPYVGSVVNVTEMCDTNLDLRAKHISYGMATESVTPTVH